MSTPTEYRLLKERHEALVDALDELAGEWARRDARSAIPRNSIWIACAQELNELLLEGGTR